MKRFARMASIATAFALLVSMPVASPAQSGKTEKMAEAEQEVKGVKLRAGKRSGQDVDARHCLRFSNNLEVIRCAERYR